MSIQIEIVNKALGHISVAPITSMVESSPAAILANSIWDSCRKEVLKGHDWSFATVIVSLSTSNYTIVAQDWQYAYQYPSDALEVWHVYFTAQDKKQDFRVVYDSINSAKVILSNIPDAIGEYTYDLTTTTGYDSNFVSVLSYFLAANMAKPLTGDSALADSMLKIYNAYMSDAERMSSYEAGGPTEPRSAFVDARAGATLASDDHYQIPQRQP
jgi:hypothetical protein